VTTCLVLFKRSGLKSLGCWTAVIIDVFRRPEQQGTVFIRNATSVAAGMHSVGVARQH